MLTLYMACLIGGGIFVALSVFSGLDKDVDFDADQGDLSDFDAVDVASDVDAELSLSGHGSLADTGHGLERSKGAAPKRLWLPFMSFRFWTFGAAFFGMTGTVLSLMALSSEPLTLALSSGVGLLVGSASAYVIRLLQRPVGQTRVRASDITGASGVLLFNLSADGLSKVRLEGFGGSQELIAVAEGDIELAKGARVIVIGLDEEGRVRVSPEQEFFALEEG